MTFVQTAHVCIDCSMVLTVTATILWSAYFVPVWKRCGLVQTFTAHFQLPMLKPAVLEQWAAVTLRTTTFSCTDFWFSFWLIFRRIFKLIGFRSLRDKVYRSVRAYGGETVSPCKSLTSVVDRYLWSASHSSCITTKEKILFAHWIGSLLGH